MFLLPNEKPSYFQNSDKEVHSPILEYVPSSPSYHFQADLHKHMFIKSDVISNFFLINIFIYFLL